MFDTNTYSPVTFALLFVFIVAYVFFLLYEQEPAINEFYEEYGQVPRSFLQHRGAGSKESRKKADQVKIVELNSDEEDQVEEEKKGDEEEEDDQVGEKYCSSGSTNKRKMKQETEQVKKKEKAIDQSDSAAAGPSNTGVVRTVNRSPSLTKELVFIAWNIDGLDDKNLSLRTINVATIVKKANAHVVFFQEVIEESESLLRSHLQEYLFISGREWKGFNANYYVMTALRKDSVGLISHQTVDFENSVMTRNLLISRIEIGGVVVNLGNTHLESTSDHAPARLNQMRRVLQYMQQVTSKEPVIIAGDLNTKDKEVTSLGGLPNGCIDVWEATGKRPECAYTWDLLRNDNKQVNTKFKPRCRFDRIWVRDSKPSHLIPLSFDLIGIQRLKPHICFPSDHWGLLSVMKLFK